MKLIGSSGADEDPQYSPDGRRIAFSSTRSGASEIWMCSDEGLNCVQLTHLNSPLAGSPSWSPDGSKIVFDANVHHNTDVYVVNSDGTARCAPA